MRKLYLFVVVLGILLPSCISTFSICGTGGNLVFAPQFRIDNFNSYFDSNGNPLDTLVLDTSRIYSPNFKFYLDYSDKNASKNKRMKLYHHSGKLITKIKDVTKHDHITWLNNCLIFNGSSAPKPRKIIVDLSSGNTKVFKTKGWFMYIGQTDSKAYYVSHSDYQKIGRLKVESRHSIIELDEKSQGVLYDNESVEGRYLSNVGAGLRFRWYSYSKDTVHFFKFYNPQLAIKGTKLSRKSDDEFPLAIDCIVNDTVRYNSFDTQRFFARNDFYYGQGKTYIIIDGQQLVVSDGNTLTKLIDLEQTELIVCDDFKVYGKFMVFTQFQGFMFMKPKNHPEKQVTVNGLLTNFNNDGHSVIGFLNLETKEVFYPVITYK